MTTEYEFHPIAGLFPLIEGEQYEKFKTDIAEHGQREPGVIYEGRVLEGRNRYRAQKDLGREFICDELPAGVDPYAFVISANIRRRHLTSEQATDLANKIANLKRGEHLNPPNGGFAPEQPEPPKSSQEQAASMVPGVTVRQMQRMKRLEREAPDLHKKVVNEKIKIGAAEAELKLRKKKARTAAETQSKPPTKTSKPDPAPKGKPVPTPSKATQPEETQAHIKGEPVTLHDIINAWVATRALVNAAPEMHKAAWKEELLDLIHHDIAAGEEMTTLDSAWELFATVWRETTIEDRASFVISLMQEPQEPELKSFLNACQKEELFSIRAGYESNPDLDRSDLIREMRKEEEEAKEEEEPAPAPESAKSPAPAPAAANGATEPVCSPELQAAMKKLEQQKRTYAEFRRAANTKQRLDFIREAAPELAEQEMELIKAEAIVQERMEQALARHNAKAAQAEAE